MRARNIKPGFFTDAELVECSPLTRILFAGLWCMSDRDGRLKDKPKQIKIEVLPCDDCDVDQMLNELNQRQRIIRYEVDGDHYIQVVNFLKHQRPHPKEISFNYPAPPEQAVELHGKKLNYTANPSSSLIPSSLNPSSLIPESLNPESPPIVPPKGGTGERKKRVKQPAPPAEGFGDFWILYPRKEGKVKAIEAWNRITPEPELQKTICAAVRLRAATTEWRKDGGQFIPLPATWLNGQRWDDEVGPGSSVRQVSAKTEQNIANAQAWLKKEE